MSEDRTRDFTDYLHPHTLIDFTHHILQIDLKKPIHLHAEPNDRRTSFGSMNNLAKKKLSGECNYTTFVIVMVKPITFITIRWHVWYAHATDLDG